MKLQRKYKLFIETLEGDTLVIEPPFTLVFQVQRNNLASANTFNCSIYNLSKKTRDKIFQDRYNPKIRKKIILQAGYNSLSTIFVGNIFYAYSERSGSNILTNIMARDGGYDISNTLSRFTLDAGTSNLEVIKQLVKDFKYIEKGEFGEIEGYKNRGVVCMGNTIELIKRETGDHFFVDLEKIYIMKETEALDAVVPLINSENGLIGTPRREDSYLSLDMIFEPRIGIGQVVNIESQIQTQFNGQFKVIGISHSGIISEAVSGNCTTTINLLLGSQVFGQFNSNKTITDKANEASNPVLDSETSTERQETTSVKPKELKIINKDLSEEFQKPLTGSVSSEYGYRTHPIFNKRKMHTGIDIAVARNTIIKPVKSGTVTYTGWLDGYGKTVKIDHSNGYSSLYAHMNNINVTKGQSITQKDILGRVGSTGYSTGPHLHLEVHKNGKHVNPRSYIKGL